MTDDAEPTELSPRARERLADLRYIGEFGEEEAAARGCRLVIVAHGAEQADDRIHLHWLVDSSGFIRDARFRSPATGLCLVAYDLMTELCVGITIEQAKVIAPAHVAERLRLVYDQDQVDLPWNIGAPFPVIVKAVNRARGEVAPEADAVAEERQAAEQARQSRAEEWEEMGLFERVRRIEAVLDDSVRPMLASDGGGVDLIDLAGDELVIQYQGACGSCSSAIGGTLQYLEDALHDGLGVRLRLNVQGLEYEPFIDL